MGNPPDTLAVFTDNFDSSEQSVLERILNLSSKSKTAFVSIEDHIFNSYLDAATSQFPKLTLTQTEKFSQIRHELNCVVEIVWSKPRLPQ